MPEASANADMITAAPDMYEALCHAQIVILNLGELTQQQHLLKLEINKALAKVEGKSWLENLIKDDREESKMIEIKAPPCPDCGHSKMHRHSTIMSGRNKRQQWMCPKCGKTLVYPKSAKK